MEKGKEGMGKKKAGKKEFGKEREGRIKLAFWNVATREQR